MGEKSILGDADKCACRLGRRVFGIRQFGTEYSFLGRATYLEHRAHHRLVGVFDRIFSSGLDTPSRAHLGQHFPAPAGNLSRYAMYLIRERRLFSGLVDHRQRSYRQLGSRVLPLPSPSGKTKMGPAKPRSLTPADSRSRRAHNRPRRFEEHYKTAVMAPIKET